MQIKLPTGLMTSAAVSLARTLLKVVIFTVIAGLIRKQHHLNEKTNKEGGVHDKRHATDELFLRQISGFTGRPTVDEDIRHLALSKSPSAMAATLQRRTELDSGQELLFGELP